MNKMVEQKMNEMTEVFNSLPNCRIETDEAGRILIVSDNPVPWSDTESTHKIGSITPHKAALGLYIDFPHNYIEIDRLDDIIDPEFTLTYYEPGTKTSTVKSWWRFRSDEKFDSIHLVLRKTELELYDFKRDDWVGLMGEITAVHK
ncbi:hypothetical protein QL992_06025 [Microbacterium sp. APC 3898]|uniref:Uncharacterized protein n=1 Tax=Planococcus notacanthi TaxID=3035188 RepID=A0ABT7ZMZ9_9BACL|nr:MULTISPECIES: hypothetical protein [Terrabacteria group]MDN3428535.1 hypothetical protein [Planococcus sp. APC 4016]MDN3498758.1 hypothetical protein [Microbacterium sp. APC 3898]